MKFFVLMLLAVAPLPYGSAMPVWQLFWVVTIGAAALFSVYKPLSSLQKKQRPASLFYANLILAVFIIWGFLQAYLSLGLSTGKFSNLFPDHATISIFPQQTVKVATLFLSHWVFFLLVYDALSRDGNVARFVKMIGVIVVTYAVIGLFLFYSGHETNPWYAAWSDKGALSSTFVNRNNFAAFVGLGLQCLVAYVFFIRAEGRYFTPNPDHTLATGISFLLQKYLWLALALIVLVSSLTLTNSRAGVTSVTLALAALAFFNEKRSGHLLKKTLSYGFIVAIVFSIFLISGDKLSARLQVDGSVNQRLLIFPILLDILLDRPLEGYGLGSFETIFRLYQDETIVLYFDRAHNDFIELAITAGLPATLLFLLAVLIIILAPIWNKRKGGRNTFTVLGVTSSLQLGLHALLDFPFQIPAISYIWCAILAASFAVHVRVIGDGAQK